MSNLPTLYLPTYPPGADLNAQFKIVYPNGKLADNASMKAKQSETLAQVGFNEWVAGWIATNPFNPPLNSPYQRIPLNPPSQYTHVTHTLSTQEQKDAENASDAILKKIKPEVKTAFLSSDVRYTTPTSFHNPYFEVQNN